MSKKDMKYGNVNFGPEEFNSGDAMMRISMMIPESLYKDLKRLSLTEEYSGKYQTLAREILLDYCALHKGKKKKKIS